MEQNMELGLILGRLAILKKMGAVKYANFEGGVFTFSLAKNTVASAMKSCIISIL